MSDTTLILVAAVNVLACVWGGWQFGVLVGDLMCECRLGRWLLKKVIG